MTEQINDFQKDALHYLHMLEGDGVELLGKTAVSTKSTVEEPGDVIDFKSTVMTCKKCPELAMCRNSVVFGDGNMKADLVFVGEAPGAEEDRQGLPFVGKAGQLLTKMIEAIQMRRQDVYICNVIKCRPPNNRTPLPDEIGNCLPYLEKQIKTIQPRIVCALGAVAARALLNTTRSISSMRGHNFEYQGAKLIVTYHPAYLLRNPADKKKAWEDLKRVRSELQS